MTRPAPGREPVHPYFRYASRPMAILVSLLLLGMVPLSLAAWMGWSERIQAMIFAGQMFVLGILLAPTLPIWRRMPRANDPQEPPPDTPTFRDGF